MDLTAKHPSKSCKDEKLSFLDELGHFKKRWRTNFEILTNIPEMERSSFCHNVDTLQVTRRQAGNYTCHASNVEGDAESRPVSLTIMCQYLII